MKDHFSSFHSSFKVKISPSISVKQWTPKFGQRDRKISRIETCKENSEKLVTRPKFCLNVNTLNLDFIKRDIDQFSDLQFLRLVEVGDSHNILEMFKIRKLNVITSYGRVIKHCGGV